MRNKNVYQSETIHLRTCELSDCTPEYVAWLADPIVNQYLETRWSAQTIDSIKDFVQSILNSDHSWLFAIVDNQTNAHIGNIKIGPVHPHYKYADISYFIGDKNYWGKGIATQAITLVTDFGFNELNLHRVQAGVFEKNIGSCKALEKVGFMLEGRQKKQLLDTEGNWQDHLYYGKLNPDNT